MVDATTGIAELPGVEHMILMPNPAENELVLRIDASNEQKLGIDVFDATGRTVIAPTQASFTGTMARSIDVSTLTPGTYHLRITGANGPTTLPFVKR